MYAMASTFGEPTIHAFFDDLVRCQTRLYNALGERLRAEHGIATAQFELLRYLRDHPRSRVREVAATFAAGVGAISKMTDRLETAGWATRTPNPTDGRSSLISLTDQGAALVAAAERIFDQALAELISPTLDATQVRAAGAALAVLRHALEDARAGLPIG